MTGDAPEDRRSDAEGTREAADDRFDADTWRWSTERDRKSTAESDEWSNSGESNAARPAADDDWGRIPIDLTERPEKESPKLEEGDDSNDVPSPEPASTPIESGTPSLENAVFVVLGALLMLGVLFRLGTVAIG